jgi:C-22 sterol desaturase
MSAMNTYSMDKAHTNSKTITATVLTLVISLLILEQVVYRNKKQHLPGSTWTIPVIGKFADSLNPTLENYKKAWNAGPLSCVSVFNMYVPSHVYHSLLRR